MFIHLHSNWSGLSVQFDIFWNMNMNKIHNNLKTATWLQNYALNCIFFFFFLIFILFYFLTEMRKSNYG